MELENVLVQRISKHPQWLQVGITGATDRVSLDGGLFFNPPVLANAEPYITAGSTVLVAKLDSGIVVLGRINPSMTGGSGTTAWANLPLTNGWGIYGAGFFNPQYRRVGDEVQLRGLLAGFGALSPATLPAGFRPTAQALLMTMASGGPWRVDIGTDGALQLLNPITGPGWLSLDSLRFSTS